MSVSAPWSTGSQWIPIGELAWPATIPVPMLNLAATLASIFSNDSNYVGGVHFSPISAIAGTVGTIPSTNKHLYGMNNLIWLLDSGASRHVTGRLFFA